MIDPRGLTALQWFDLTAQTLSSIVSMPILRSEKEWRLYAEILSGASPLGSYAPPSPVGFDNWEEWAERFIQAVPL